MGGGWEGKWEGRRVGGGGRESETGKDININQWHHSVTVTTCRYLSTVPDL